MQVIGEEENVALGSETHPSALQQAAQAIRGHFEHAHLRAN